MAAEHEDLTAGLRAAGVAGELAERLAHYGALLLEANRKVNLTGAKDVAALLPHLLDALTLAGDVSESLVDVGSGGGLPGIPLALATGVRVLLVEPTVKKAAFLERALVACGIEGEVVAQRAEVAGRTGGSITAGSGSDDDKIELVIHAISLGRTAQTRRFGLAPRR